MKRLHLLRHAKSSWEDDSLPDHERPLAHRGRRATTLLAGWIAEHDVRPELVRCSTATRARETLAAVAAALGEPQVAYEPALYHAAPRALLEHVRSLPDVHEALLVGHNPGLQQLAVLLATPSPERARIAEKLPTGALVTLALDVDRWQDVDAACATVAALVVPRELE